MAKKSSLTIGHLILMIIILILALYIGYGKYADYQQEKLDEAYRQGVRDAEAAINQEIIRNLNTQGFVFFTYLRILFREVS